MVASYRRRARRNATGVPGQPRRRARASELEVAPAVHTPSELRASSMQIREGKDGIPGLP